jgi:membrane-bound ClpP family serine protease
MNKHLSSLFYGLALGFGFIGLMGFAIDSSKWIASMILILIGVFLLGIEVSMRKEK